MSIYAPDWKPSIVPTVDNPLKAWSIYCIIWHRIANTRSLCTIVKYVKSISGWKLWEIFIWSIIQLYRNHTCAKFARRGLLQRLHYFNIGKYTLPAVRQSINVYIIFHYNNITITDFLCDICGAQFQTSNHLKNHKLTHGPRTLQCPNCDRRFATKKQLRVHCFIHQNAKFVCNICNAKLSNIRALSSHKS